MMENKKNELKKAMLDTMLNVVSHYRSDIVDDFEFIDNLADQKVIWLLRDTGTDIGYYSDLSNPDKWITLSIPRSKYAFVIEDFKLVEVDINALKAGIVE